MAEYASAIRELGTSEVKSDVCHYVAGFSAGPAAALLPNPPVMFAGKHRKAELDKYRPSKALH